MTLNQNCKENQLSLPGGVLGKLQHSIGTSWLPRVLTLPVPEALYQAEANVKKRTFKKLENFITALEIKVLVLWLGNNYSNYCHLFSVLEALMNQNREEFYQREVIYLKQEKWIMQCWQGLKVREEDTNLLESEEPCHPQISTNIVAENQKYLQNFLL